MSTEFPIMIGQWHYAKNSMEKVDVSKFPPESIELVNTGEKKEPNEDDEWPIDRDCDI